MRARARARARRSKTGLLAGLVSLGSAALVAGIAACAASGVGQPQTFDDGSADAHVDGGATSDAASSSSCNDADLSTDWTNCGACGHTCAAGQVCNGGTCQAPCAAPLSNCPGTTQCFDLTTDLDNCGGCGNTCPAPPNSTPECVQSQCDFTCAADAGVKCAADSGGAPGCVDLSSTDDHCGACNVQCTGGQQCVQGTCCALGDKLCGGQCTPVASDPNNCGDCGKSCPSPGQCVSGQCVGYAVSNPTVTFIDACTLGGSTVLQGGGGGSWTMSAGFPLPFSFTFFGGAQTTAFVGNEGTLGFGAPNPFLAGYPDCKNPNPFTVYPALVAYGDTNLDTTSAGVCYGTTGTAPSRQFVATWSNATNLAVAGSVVTFSIILTETTNTIDFVYETASASADGGANGAVSGNNATVGIQSPGPNSTEYSLKEFCGSGSGAGFITTTPMAIRFTPL